jgi:hypothetical protein
MISELDQYGKGRKSVIDETVKYLEKQIGQLRVLKINEKQCEPINVQIKTLSRTKDYLLAKLHKLKYDNETIKTT